METLSNIWPEIASALIAALALVVALQVRHENRKYKAPDFRLTPFGQTPEGRTILKLTNNGETVAKNVKIRFAIDPTAILSRSPLEWEVIDKDETVEIMLDTPVGLQNSAVVDWLAYTIGENPGRRVAVVEYTTRLGKRESGEVLIPNAQELLDAVGLYWRKEPDSQ